MDFNGIQDDGRISALRRHADDPEAVTPGAVVELWDEDGNTAQGRVVDLGPRDLARIEVMPGTWQPGPDPQPWQRSIFISFGASGGGAVTSAGRILDFWVQGGPSEVVILFLQPHHGSLWGYEVHSVDSTASTTAQPAPAGR